MKKCTCNSRQEGKSSHLAKLDANLTCSLVIIKDKFIHSHLSCAKVSKSFWAVCLCKCESCFPKPEHEYEVRWWSVLTTQSLMWSFRNFWSPLERRGWGFVVAFYLCVRVFVLLWWGLFFVLVWVFFLFLYLEIDGEKLIQQLKKV